MIRKLHSGIMGVSARAVGFVVVSLGAFVALLGAVVSFTVFPAVIKARVRASLDLWNKGSDGRTNFVNGNTYRNERPYVEETLAPICDR